MAVTSTIEYCTDRDIQDIYPHISEYDLKRRLYSWTLAADNFDAGTLDLYYLNGTGLISQLFWDGLKLTKIAFPTSSHTLANEAIDLTETVITVDAGHSIQSYDFLKIDNEYLKVASVSTNDITVTRGFSGTIQAPHADDSPIYRVADRSEDMDQRISDTGGVNFIYDSDMDLCLLITVGADPNQHIVEAGDDWGTIKTRFRRKASRLIESHLDNRLSREVLKDREGNYPEIIIHATALQTVILLLKAHDPNNELIEPFKSELEEIIDGLKAGSITLPTSISGDSSKGVIREVSVNSSSDLRPIELRGNYNGTGYELLKVYIDSGEGGIIGTTKMTVKGKDGDLLKNNELIDSQVITGDFDFLGVGNLYIRWSGDDVTSAITTATDEYEIELWGSSLDTTISSVGSIKMTRR